MIGGLLLQLFEHLGGGLLGCLCQGLARVVQADLHLLAGAISVFQGTGGHGAGVGGVGGSLTVNGTVIARGIAEGIQSLPQGSGGLGFGLVHRLGGLGGLIFRYGERGLLLCSGQGGGGLCLRYGGKRLRGGLVRHGLLGGGGHVGDHRRGLLRVSGGIGHRLLLGKGGILGIGGDGGGQRVVIKGLDLVGQALGLNAQLAQNEGADEGVVLVGIQVDGAHKALENVGVGLFSVSAELAVPILRPQILGQPQRLDPIGQIAIADVVGAHVGELLHGAHEKETVLQHVGVLIHEVVGDVVIHQGVAVEFQHLVVGGLGVDLEIGLAGEGLNEQALVVEGVADGLLDLADGLGVLGGEHK